MAEGRGGWPVVVAMAAVTMAVMAVVSPAARAHGGRPIGNEGPHEVLRRVSRSAAETLPPGFTDRAVLTGMSLPSVVQFAPDGRVFMGQKAGTILEFDSIDDPNPTLVADLSTNVYNWGDRGLLGLALDPNFETSAYLYVLYTLDAPIGGQPPVYGDQCHDPNGYCVAGARLSRMLVDAQNHAGPESVLIEGWCQQYNSHSIGTLAFGPDGALYVGAGDGANFNAADWGQFGNPCQDPPSEGGALRAQDAAKHGDPTGLNGAILRVDPNTGDPLPDNPLTRNNDPTDDRIIAFGLRNPFRFAVRPNSSRIWVGDVGWNSWEEIDRIGSADNSRVEDFGWPCYEGQFHQGSYDAANLPICEDRLYSGRVRVTLPKATLAHSPTGCGGSNVISAVGFYTGARYPADYTGAFFFGDVVRGCLWWMQAKPTGDPDTATLQTFATGLYAVDLKTGPNGDLFYVDIYGGSLHEVSYTGVAG